MRHVRHLAVALCVAVTALAPTPVAATEHERPVADEAGAAPRPDLPEEPVLTLPAVAPEAERLLVRFTDGVAGADRASVLGATRTRAVGAVPGTDFVLVDPGSTAPDAALAALAADPRVADVQPDHVRTATALPDDPLLEHAWPYLELVGLPRAWDRTTGSGAVVAVLDTAVDASHPELAGRVLPGHDFVDDDADPTDRSGGALHGTAVAGVAAAAGDNGLGIAGAAWDARVMPVRVLDAEGAGRDSDIAAAIVWAADRGADVINLSFGGPDGSPVLLTAIEHAVSRGSAVVAAAGNGAVEGVLFPAAYADDVDGLLAVAATDDDGVLAPFSSWGDEVSLAAPGTELIAPRAGGGFVLTSGTSLAAPLVSGAAALLAGAATPAQVEASLTGSARDAGPRGVDPYYGAGILDAAGAVGLRRAVPLDRLPGDPGLDDSVPARAQPLDVDQPAEATLWPEGDEDWYSVRLPAAGWYRVTVTPERNGLGTSDLLPAVTALDGDGATLAATTGTVPGAAVSVEVPATAARTVRLGVRGAAGGTRDPGYTVRVTFASTTRLTGFSTPIRHEYSGPVAVGDVTGDGRPDLVEVPGDGTTVRVHRGLGDGTVGDAVEQPVGVGTQGVGMLDADGDGDQDVVVATDTGYLVLLQSSGRLVEGHRVRLGDFGVWAVRVADMDRDGREDLVLAVDARTEVHLGTGDGRFVAAGGFDRAYGTFAVGDLTGDGRPDVAGPDGRVFAQQPDGTFSLLVQLPDEDDWDVPAAAVEIADVTGDGRLDLVRSSPWLGVIGVVAGTSDGGLGPTRTYPAGLQPAAVRAGDMNGDGRTDVVVVNHTAASISVLLQRPDGTLGAPEVVPALWVQASRDTLELADLDRDGHLDVVVRGDWRLQVLKRHPLDVAPGPRAWVVGSGTAPHAAGVPARPLLTVTTGRPVATGSVSAGTVRLVDGLTGRDVAATRSHERAGGVISVRPSADLVPGRHYALVVAGLTDTAGSRQDRPFRTWFTVGAGGDRFTPVEPFRVLDTREGLGAWPEPVTPGSPVRLELGGVVVPPEATAVVLNVTATGATAGGNVRVYPTPEGPDVPPLVSNLNVVPGVDQPNAVTVRLGADGQVSLATDGLTAHLVADVAGYYSAGGATAYVPRDPVRVLDTRDGTGGVAARPVPRGGWIDVVVAGRGGVPADAGAVVLNVTGTGVAGGTNVRVYPTPADSGPQEPPTVSNLNLQPGRDQANLVTVAVGEGGKVRLYTQSAAVHLLADLAGYFAPTGDHGFVPIDPTRVVDTRSGLGSTGRLIPAQARTLALDAVPATAAAVVMNVTGVLPDAVTNVRAFPPTADGSVPLVSTLNLVRGRTEPNLAVVRLGSDRTMSFYSQSAGLDLVVDVGGYFHR